ncbi:hypothetical protein [Pseudoflavonifractor phocaeensis]|uniref:hypothetical protein n=1 Tax=Pseudoflavonifractor phocaeensis TaxID=1870988 RepID=UPI00195B8AC8|nr:hypothetical protein [Pseudoflavonifractor phocaeensis]
MVTKAKMEANRRWDRDNMTSLSCRVRREYAERVKEVCRDSGDTINSILKAALDQYLAQHGQLDDV